MTLTLQLVRSARVPLELNAEGVHEVAIVTDTAVEGPAVEALVLAAAAMGMEPTVVFFAPRGASGHEPPRVAASALRGADLMLLACSTSMAHTEAVRSALRDGVKYVGLPGISVDTLLSGAATADYAVVGRITELVASSLTAARRVRITSPGGSDLTLSIEGRSAHRLDGVFRPGSIACFPDGESPIAVVEGTGDGKLVVDSSIAGIGLLREPVVFYFEGGRLVRTSGGDQASEVHSLLESHGDQNSWIIGEFAIGTNPRARRVPNVNEDKKRLGTIHLGLGDNVTLGGKNHSRTHIDVVASGVSVWADGLPILEDGRLVLVSGTEGITGEGGK